MENFGSGCLLGLIRSSVNSTRTGTSTTGNLIASRATAFVNDDDNDEYKYEDDQMITTGTMMIFTHIRSDRLKKSWQ